jgi:perosamine synthetase
VVHPRPHGDALGEFAVAPPLPHSKPSLRPEDAAAVADVVRSGHIAQGAVAQAVERRWCELTHASDAACVGSGTGALRLALHALGVGSGDEVIVPAYSCAALLNATLALNATPVLADIDRDDWTLSVEDTRRRVGARTKAIVAVHIFGLGAQLDELAELGIPLVEDCAHAVGGATARGPFGGGGTIAMSSFQATKLIGAGEGGIVSSRDAELIDRVHLARDNGAAPPNGRHLNDHFTDLGAALALAQLERLEETLGERAALAARYDELLAPLSARGVAVPPKRAQGRVWYRYAVRLPHHKAEEVCRRSAAEGVLIKRPVALQLRECPYREYWVEPLEQTTEALLEVVSLPLYPGLDELDQQRVVGTLTACLD